MRVDFLTIFPGLISGALEYGLLMQARQKGLLEFNVVNLRDFAKDRHRSVDDVPYGGGPGMVFKPEPVFEAVEAIRTADCRVILPGPQGRRFTRQSAQVLASRSHLIFICGRYEGVDERIREGLADEEYSIGDFVTMGGELPALIMTEAVTRFVPGVVGDEQSVQQDSFQEPLLDYPHYTRPAEFRGMKVPDVLLSGHHEQVRIWRRRMMLQRTLSLRPELLQQAELTEEDRRLLKDLENENETAKNAKSAKLES